MSLLFDKKLFSIRKLIFDNNFLILYDTGVNNEGFYVKSGQMAAANIGNAFPPIWQKTMAPLQDECPSRSFEVVKGIIESEFGRGIYEVFGTFEESPIGAAR